MSTEPFPQQPAPGSDQTPPSASVPPPGYGPYEPGPGAPMPGDAMPGNAMPGGPHPSGTDRFFGSIRRLGLVRSDDRWVGGVAGGVAERLGWDPLLVRGLLFASFFLTGLGLVVYAVGWALLPERKDGRIHLEQAIRGDFDAALIGAAVALVVGFSRAGGVITFWHGGWTWVGQLFWLAVWIGGIWLVVRLIHERRRERRWTSDPLNPNQGPGASGPDYTGSAAPFAQPSDGGASAGTTGYGPAGTGSTGYAPSGYGFGGDAPQSPPVPPADDPAYAAQMRAQAAAQARVAGAQARAAARAEAAQVRVAQARQAAEARTAAAHARAAEAQARAAERARRPITKGAGAATVGVVLGLLLILGAVLLSASRQGWSLPWPFDGGIEPGLAWLGAALVVVGGAIIVSGIRGRSSGWLGFLAIVALVVAVPWSLSTNDSPWLRVDSGTSSWREVSDRGITVSDGVTTPRSVQEAENGFRASFGDPTIDLSSLDLSGATARNPIEVPVQISAGDLTIRVPRDVAVEAEVRLWAGQIRWEVDDESRTFNRAGGGTARLTSDEAVDDGAVLRLLVSSRAGNVTIEEG